MVESGIHSRTIKNRRVRVKELCTDSWHQLKLGTILGSCRGESKIKAALVSISSLWFTLIRAALNLLLLGCNLKSMIQPLPPS